MMTAVDTSVLLDVFSASPAYLAASQQALRQAIRDGGLVACDVVWAELRPWFPDRATLDKTMERLGVTFLPPTKEAALLAGEIWKKYRSAGGPREHLVPDFLIAAHASVQADRLLTRDRGFYRKWFGDLKLLLAK
jgi:predicted nucleic acid-binding protein